MTNILKFFDSNFRKDLWNYAKRNLIYNKSFTLNEIKNSIINFFEFIILVLAISIPIFLFAKNILNEPNISYNIFIKLISTFIFTIMGVLTYMKIRDYIAKLCTYIKMHNHDKSIIIKNIENNISGKYQRLILLTDFFLYDPECPIEAIYILHHFNKKFPMHFTYYNALKDEVNVVKSLLELSNKTIISYGKKLDRHDFEELFEYVVKNNNFKSSFLLSLIQYFPQYSSFIKKEKNYKDIASCIIEELGNDSKH